MCVSVNYYCCGCFPSVLSCEHCVTLICFWIWMTEYWRLGVTLLGFYSPLKLLSIKLLPVVLTVNFPYSVAFILISFFFCAVFKLLLVKKLF